MAYNRIIGGEYLINPNVLDCGTKHCSTPKLSLGRTCFYSILEAIKKEIGGILVPDYLCSSIAEVPVRIRMGIKHYHISPEFLPDMDEIGRLIESSNEKLAILLISYFGLIDLNEIVLNIRARFPGVIIIIDDVQNYYGFGKYDDYDYCFSSYRKWFAVPDGADILRKKNMPETREYIEQGKYVAYKTSGNILKNYKNIIGDEIAIELIDKGEELIDNYYLCGCSDVGKLLFKRLEFESIANTRKRNAAFLHNGLVKIGIRHLYDDARVPLFIPIIIKNRDMVRNRLFEKCIFAPVHWPVVDSNLQGDNELYKNELSLICDQRYTEEDMDRIIRVIEDAI